MIKLNLSVGDNSINQIKESLNIITKIDDCFNKREKIELDLSDIKWVLPCSVILISGKLMEILNKGAEVSYIPPKNKNVKGWLSDIGFPLGKKDNGDTFISIKGISGEIHIVSRKGIAIIKPNQEPEFYDFDDVSLEGTFLYFRLPTPKKEVNIYPYLEG